MAAYLFWNPEDRSPGCTIKFPHTADEIKKCVETAGAKILIYGPEFIERINDIKDDLSFVESFIFVGENCPDHCENYEDILSESPSAAPKIKIHDTDDAALYFTSGTTGTPKPILLTHANLVSACITEQDHHKQCHEDCFLCIPHYTIPS